MRCRFLYSGSDRRLTHTVHLRNSILIKRGELQRSDAETDDDSGWVSFSPPIFLGHGLMVETVQPFTQT